MKELKRSQELFLEAQRYLPGGVNSPVRAFKAVGGTPPFIVKGRGQKFTMRMVMSSLITFAHGGH